jgi:hypothetical protein
MCQGDYTKKRDEFRRLVCVRGARDCEVFRIVKDIAIVRAAGCSALRRVEAEKRGAQKWRKLSVISGNATSDLI